MNIKKGDWIVCVCDKWESFTYGKKYKVLSDVNFNLVDVINDFGENPVPCLYGYDEGKRVDYFITLDQWREINLNKIGI